SGCAAPGGVYRPGSVRSIRSDSRARRRSSSLRVSMRAVSAASSACLTSLACCPTFGRSAAGSEPSERSSRVSSPERPRTRTRSASRSDVDRAPAISARARSWICWTRGSPFTLGAARRSRRLRQLGEGGGVVHGELGQDLPTQRDAGFLEPIHESRVREPEGAARRVHADDPERARPPLLLLAPPVGEGARPKHRLRGRTVEAPPPAEVALRLLENFLPALAGLPPALGPWHGVAPLLQVRYERLDARVTGRAYPR